MYDRQDQVDQTNYNDPNHSEIIIQINKYGSKIVLFFKNNYWLSAISILMILDLLFLSFKTINDEDMIVVANRFVASRSQMITVLFMVLMIIALNRPMKYKKIMEQVNPVDLSHIKIRARRPNGVISHKSKDQLFGSKLAKTKYGTICRTKRGEMVKSIGEMKIANILLKHQIDYHYEREVYYGDQRIVPDFYLPDYHLIVEYYGMYDETGSVGKKYRKKARKKKKIYLSMKFQFLDLYPEDTKNLFVTLIEKLDMFSKVR